MIEQIIRNIKLSIISDIELDEPWVSIYDEIKDIFKDLNIYSHVYSDSTYYGYSKSEICLEYNSLFKTLYIDRCYVIDRFENYKHQCSDFDYMFHIKLLIQFYSKNALHIDCIFDSMEAYLNVGYNYNIDDYKKVGKV